MIRPRTPGMYRFRCEKPTTVIGPGGWIVGIVFRSTSGRVAFPWPCRHLSAEAHLSV